MPGDEAVPLPREAGGDPGDHRDEDHPQVSVSRGFDSLYTSCKVF